MITFKEVDKSFFELYDKVSMNVNVQSEYEVKRINGGLGGLVFEEVPVEPYIKDLSIYERAIEYEKEFDITNWRFYMAFDDDYFFQCRDCTYAPSTGRRSNLQIIAFYKVTDKQVFVTSGVNICNEYFIRQ